jgi:hypothetical protein
MCPQKRRKRDGKEGSLPGRRGSESQIKSSRKKKAAFAAVTCHAKHGFSGQTRKKKKKTAATPVTNSVFFFPPSDFYPQSYFSSNFCPQSCSHSRLFPVPFSRETQERARRSARERDESACGEWSTNAAALLSADNSQHLQWSPVCNFRFEKR